MNAQGGECGNALNAALIRKHDDYEGEGYVEIAQFLIEKGAEAKTIARECRETLQEVLALMGRPTVDFDDDSEDDLESDIGLRGGFDRSADEVGETSLGEQDGGGTHREGETLDKKEETLDQKAERGDDGGKIVDKLDRREAQDDASSAESSG